MTIAAVDSRDRGDEAGSEDFVERTRQTMKAFAGAWNAGDIDALMALFGGNPVYRTSSGAVFAGRAALRDGLVKMCQPPASDGTHAPAEPKMHFFGRTCLAYWRLTLANGETRSTVDGVDVITFDDDARVICKDAYRKLA